LEASDTLRDTTLVWRDVLRSVCCAILRAAVSDMRYLSFADAASPVPIA
jgi:hypothetical protein